MNFQLRSLSIAHEWVRQAVSEGDTVIDATVGNGHDTLFLAKLVGSEGSVIGFDVQEEALKQTGYILEGGDQDYQKRVQLHLKCHSHIAEFSDLQISAGMFNLGYLPSSDKTIITKKDTSLLALDACLDRLKLQGIITIVCYPGHDGGEDETLAVENWAQSLDSVKFSVIKAIPFNVRSRAPYLIGVQKKK